MPATNDRLVRMNFKNKLRSHGLGGLIGCASIFALACALLIFDSHLSRLLTRSSYEWSFDLARFTRPKLSGSDVVIVYMDEDSYTSLKQPLNAPWDRALHARLIDRLKNEGAKAVVMDIVFSDPGPDEKADRLLAEAIRSNGRVVLAADYNKAEAYNANEVKATVKKTTPLFPPFEEAAAIVGLAQLEPDDDFLVRRHLHFLNRDLPPSLSWATAQMLNLKVTQNPAEQWAEKWVYYYGPPETVPHVSYKQALEPDGVKPDFFRNKIVFIGARPITGTFIEKRDELRSPYASQNREFLFMPMVEIHATEFLNLLREDWLKRPSPAAGIAILVLSTLLFGFGLLLVRPWVATAISLLGILAVVLVAGSFFTQKHLWFPWMIIVAVQIPCALLWSILFRFLEWYVQRRRLEAERRQADLQIREQAALLDKAQDAIIVHDLNWRAQYWNQSAERLYGWTFEEVKPKDLRVDVFKTDEGKLLEALQTALAKNEWSGELNQSTKAGKQLIVQSRWTLVRDDQGRPKSVLVINTDVTEQKKLESQFLRTQRMESIGTLAGGIAHDLNNVLAPILMGVELMKMKAPDEYSLKMLNTMAGSAKRGSDMVKQVLSFARGVEGDRTVLQISHLIREMQKIVKETFPKTIDFQTNVEDIWPVLGDATQIHQIILNLCVNARDAMPEGGKILVEAKNVSLSEAEAKKNLGARPINYVLLRVTDTGTGIPPEIIDKIFEPFFTTKEIGKGTGLGLSTVISIIKSHGGFLDLKSEVGKGTSFNVHLPAVAAPVPLPSAPTPPEALWGKGETVLVVDDEPSVLELTKSILNHYGYKVVTAINGADALALYSQCQETIRVVIIDMMMPVMDGPTAIRALKQQQPDLQFIAISGLMQSDKLKEQSGGAEISFISKPFHTESLLKQLRKLLTPGTANSVPPHRPRRVAPELVA
jgi:two-component system cell cycle sensor histidine kinase/response regulator CckA